MIALKTSILAIAIAIASTHAFAETPALELPTASEDLSNPVLPLKLDEVPLNSEDDDPEVETQTDTFLRFGYEGVKWVTNGALVDKIYAEISAKDYENRYGKPNPNGYGIEVAQAYITRRGFNDMVIASRQPGDCKLEGCLFQIYSLIGRTWYKQLEFHAHDIVFKHGRDENTSFVAAVAEESGSSKIYFWDGEKFSK